MNINNEMVKWYVKFLPGLSFDMFLLEGKKFNEKDVDCS